MKHILVHLDASSRSAVRLAMAQALATQQGGRLTALYGVVPGLLATPWGATDGMAAMAGDLFELDVEQRARAQALVAQAATRPGKVAPIWVDAGSSPYGSLLRHAPYADLLVLGQDDPEDPTTGALPPGLVPGALCETGRPALVVPAAGVFPPGAKRPLLAWKPCREAARALSASLPWLHRAERIDVAVQAEGPDARDGLGEDARLDPAETLQAWLKWQGVGAPVRLHRLPAGDVGEALLSVSADADSDLLVMGCYGHSRAREWVLGGATRTLLQSMTLPVLMAH